MGVSHVVFKDARGLELRAADTQPGESIALGWYIFFLAERLLQYKNEPSFLLARKSFNAS